MENLIFTGKVPFLRIEAQWK